MDGAVPLFRMEGISKRYGGVRALEKADLTVSAGSNTVRAVSGTGGGVDVSLGAISRTGGLVNFVLPDTGAITTSNADGALGGWATINGSDYAKVLSGGIVAFDATDYTNKDDAGTWLSGEIISDSDGLPDTAFFGTVGSLTTTVEKHLAELAQEGKLDDPAWWQSQLPTSTGCALAGGC